MFLFVVLIKQMAFVNTDARFKFTQFTRRKGEVTSTVNGVDALQIEVDRDLPFCTISAVAAVGLMRRSTPRTSIQRTAMSWFFRRSGPPVQILGKVTIKIQLRQASLRVPVLITINPLATADVHLGRDFASATKATWDRRNRMLTFYAAQNLILFCGCIHLGCGCPQPLLVLPLSRPGPNNINYDNI